MHFSRIMSNIVEKSQRIFSLRFIFMTKRNKEEKNGNKKKSKEADNNINVQIKRNINKSTVYYYFNYFTISFGFLFK